MKRLIPFCSLLILLVATRASSDPVQLATTLSLSQGSPVPVDPVTVGVPDASGPDNMTCREALGLDVHKPDKKAPAKDDSPPPDEPAEPTVLTLDDAAIDPHRAAHPGTLPPQLLEGPPEVLARIREVLRKGARGTPVRMSFFGASHTGGDWWTGRIRRVLQDRFGDRGHGSFRAL